MEHLVDGGADASPSPTMNKVIVRPCTWRQSYHWSATTYGRVPKGCLFPAVLPEERSAIWNWAACTGRPSTRYARAVVEPGYAPSPACQSASKN